MKVKTNKIIAFTAAVVFDHIYHRNKMSLSCTVFQILIFLLKVADCHMYFTSPIHMTQLKVTKTSENYHVVLFA